MMFQAQSETNAAVPTVPEDDITKIQEKGLAILEIRILLANLPDDLQVNYFDYLAQILFAYFF